MNLPTPDHANDAQQSPEVANRRRHERRYTVGSRFVSFVIRPGFPHARALVNDISPAGIGLVYSRRLEVGSPVFIQLGAAPQETASLRMARVIHATRREDGTWVIGCKFAHRLGAAELRLVLPEGGDGTQPGEADGAGAG